jgi:hypothetical protein
MQSEGIISRSITQDIRLKGHQSIRFMPDGFCILVSDASFRPVFLQQYIYDPTVPSSTYPLECRRIMEELQLLDFEGETVIIVDSLAFTLVPAQFFDDSLARPLLEKTSFLEDSARVAHRFIRNRNLHLVFAYPGLLDQLKEEIRGRVQVTHAAECLISLSDQVQASDHQRGFVLVEVQPRFMGLLVIKEDGIRLLNGYTLKDPSDFIFHTLNTMRQLELDRETVPVYLAGMVHREHELFGLLGKYIRLVRTTPYYLETLTKAQVLRYMILSEGNKCAL